MNVTRLGKLRELRDMRMSLAEREVHRSRRARRQAEEELSAERQRLREINEEYEAVRRCQFESGHCSGSELLTAQYRLHELARTRKRQAERLGNARQAVKKARDAEKRAVSVYRQRENKVWALDRQLEHVRGAQRREQRRREDEQGEEIAALRRGA